MLEVIVYVNLAADSLSGYDIMTLWHVPRLVDLPRVIDLYVNSKLVLLFLVLIIFGSLQCRHLD